MFIRSDNFMKYPYFCVAATKTTVITFYLFVVVFVVQDAGMTICFFINAN